MPCNSGGKKRNVMRKFRISEISGVDVPAQEGATALIMKRHAEDEAPDALEKRAMLTTTENGHAHLVQDAWFDGTQQDAGTTSETRAADDEEEHSHPWVRNPDGSVTIGAALGHSHGVVETTLVGKRRYSSGQRERMAESGQALPDGSYPIANRADLGNAVRAFGRAKDKARVARHIGRRARALGAEDALPTDGKLAELLGRTKKSKKSKGAGDAGEVSYGGGKTMPDTTTTKAGDGQPTVEQLQEQLDRANSIAALSGVEKAHFDTLKDAPAQDAFLAKSAEGRAAEIDDVAKAAHDADPVVYTTMDGQALRKSAGEALISMAKSNDDIRKENAELRKAREEDSLRKRANDELGHMPGDEATRMALLKSVESIKDEAQRTAALTVLKAQNVTMAKAFDTAGYGGAAPAPGSAAEQLDTLAKAHQKANPDLSYQQAYGAVLETAEGSELYSKSLA